MMVAWHGTDAGPRVPSPAVERERLHARYEAYCAQQAAELPALLPREGVRALYRAARARVNGEVVDPLALLVEECRRVLPLPSFDVWLADYLKHAPAYDEAMDLGLGPARGRPITMELRRVEHSGSHWVAGLHVFHEPPVWRGFITFHPEATNEVAAEAFAPLHRTADVFQEYRSEDVRERFRSFNEGTLQAFLRSALS